jgi:hypothetical protein
LNRDGWSKYNQGNNEYDFASKTVLTSGLSFTNIKVSDQVPLSYVTGITQPGSVILKISEMNLAHTAAPDSKNYLIDGPDVNYPDVFPQLIKSDLNTSIAANVNPAIVLDKYRSATILYVMSDSRYKIFAKRVTNNNISQRVEALNLSNYLDGVSGDASINGIDAVYDDKNNLIHLLLHLSNSIYYASIPYIKDNSYFGSGFYNLHFVAGDTGTNNSILSTLKTNNRVFFDSSTENEGTIPNQKPSLVLLSKKGKSGKIMAWYKNSSGEIVSKEIIPYGKTFSSNKYQGL